MTFPSSGDLSPDQIEALHKASPTASDILSNLDSLNDEISDLSPGTLPEDSLPKAVKSKPSRKGKRNKGQSRAERKLAEAAAKQAEVEGMDLDAELDSLDKQLDTQAAATAAAEVPEGQTMQEQIIQLLKDTPGAPDDTQIGLWKRQHGDNAVHVMALGEGDVYIFTHLKRGQWKKIQELMAKAQQAGAQDVEDQLKEKVISHCVLWPTPLGVEFFYNSRAGVVDSLYQVILLNSYFLSPQQAMLLTTQL